MELPRFLHPRYVPMPPPPPFSNDRNFHRLAPPLPPPPPPPPPQYRPVHAPPPPPPPYNPRQSQFTFLNPNPQIEDGPRRHLFEFANHSSRVSNRTLFDDDRPRLRVPEFDNSYSDNRPDMWDPSRVQPQNRFPILGFDHEPRHRHFNRDPLSPHRSSNKYRHELDGSSRFREEYNDGFKQNQSEEVVWGRSDSRGGSNDDSRHVGSHFVSNPRNFAGNSHVVSNSNPLREFVSNSGNYDSRRGSDDEVFWGSRGDERWGYARQPSRDVPRSSIEMEHEEIGDGDGFLLVSGKRVTHVSESGRFNNRGSREGAQEFNRTPRKKFQKKSAFLRIQMGKPSFRNRNDEECFSLAYFDESNPSTFRGKDPLVYSDDRMEDEREGSPVELDVSFKSNSLVAKAIVAPSSPAVVSDRDLTPRNRKIRKFVLPDMDFSTSQLTTVSEGVVKFDSSTHVANDPKQLEDKTTVSGIGTVRDLSSQPCSNGINVSPGKSTVEGSSKGRVSDKGGPNVGSDGMPLLNVRKKKKVMNPLSCSSSSQPTKIHGEPVNVDSSSPSPSAVLRSDEGVTHSKENVTSVGMATMHNIVLQPCPNEVTVLPENNKVDESPQARVSEKVGTDIDSGSACVPKIKRKRNRLTPPFGTSSLEKTKIHGGPVNADRAVHVLHAISNSDKGLTISQDKTTLSDIGSADDASKQSSRNEVTVSHENRAEKCSSGARFLVGGNVNVGLSSSEEIKLHKGPVNKYSSNLGMNIASSSDNEIKTQEEITVSDIGMVDASRKQPCPKQVPISLENGIIGGFSKAMASAIVGSSNSEETIIQEGFINADNSNHGTGAASSSDNCLTNSQEKISVSSTGIMDDIGNQLPTDGVAISVENSAVEGSPKAIISVVGNHKVGSGKDYTPKIKRKRKVRTPQSDLSSSRITDIYVGAVNVASSARTVDTTSSSSIKDPSPAEAEVTASGVGSLDVGPQPCTDGVSVLHRNSSMDGFSEAVASVGGGVNVGLDGTPNKYKMKRKVFAPHPDLSSPTVAEVHEGPVIADTSTSGAEVPSNSNKGLTQSEEEVGVFSIGTLCTAGLLPFSNPSTILLENSVVGGSFEAVGPVTDGFSDDGLKLQHPSIDSCSIVQESAIRNVPSSCPSGLEGEQTENSTLVMATTIPQNYIMDTESGGRGEKMDEHAAEEHDMLRTETALYGIPFELQTPNLDQRLPSSDMECDSYLLVKDDLPSVSNYLSLRADVNGVPTTNPIDELMESEPDPLSNMGSPETTSIIPGLHRLNTKLSLGQISNEKVCGDDKELYEKPVVECGSVLFTSNSSSQSTNINLKTGHATESAHSITGKTVPLLSQDTKKTTKSMNPPGGESSVRKDQLSSAVPRVFPGRSSYVFTTSKKKPSSTHIAKPRTWHRTGNASASPLPGKNFFSSTVLPQRQSPKKIGKVQSTSYIRKGNSLVRKPAPVAALPHGSHMSSSSVYRLSPSDIDEIKKSTGSESMVDVVDPSNCLRTGGMNAPFERPKTPPLPNSTQLPNFTTVSSGDCTSSPLADPLLHGCAETTSDPAKSTESKDVPKFCEDAPKSSGTPENQTDAVNDLESQGVLNDGNLVSSKMKGIIYVKRKSNQLVAASNPCDLSVHNADKTQALSSDSYYKRSKNQLIRNINQAVAVPDDSSNSEGQMAPKVISNRSSSKRRSDKVLPKTFKPSKFSLVWTLCGTKSPRKDGNSLQRQKVLPHLFPWKRATSWRSFMDNSSFISNNSSLSMISRKLLLSRKRDTVYTRSTRGFSLRKSKVLSVGGSSLKWSKSIERHSKKASEEATLAVAAVERKKREQNGAACVISGTNSRNHSSRERIFRIGSVRYKMDSSKRTLQRISDEESSGSAGLQSEKDPKKSYVPRRLVIGKDEYVRIGNGNQLIRDPKKRTRTLASEKVRWSLHTARLRLARKRKYCQFFTRFGKCNKDDGKCPYIHDPSKIAVCTKFLNSSCSNSNCKLTHKVIPERMQDCSYFLQGLCTNENCPYRHVNVNPKAFICEGFLRGYCADGNECRKKHTYVCPIFEATGICPQGSKCKLHHPKNRSNRRKRKHSREKKNARGRYFGSKHINIAEPGTAVSEKHSAPNNDDILFQEGRFSDYIRLDVSDKEAGETTDPTSEQVTLCDSDPSDVQLDDLDDLIKPIRIMN